jgi:hypothetical protein
VKIAADPDAQRHERELHDLTLEERVLGEAHEQPPKGARLALVRGLRLAQRGRELFGPETMGRHQGRSR